MLYGFLITSLCYFILLFFLILPPFHPQRGLFSYFSYHIIESRFSFPPCSHLILNFLYICLRSPPFPFTLWDHLYPGISLYPPLTFVCICPPLNKGPLYSPIRSHVYSYSTVFPSPILLSWKWSCFTFLVSVGLVFTSNDLNLGSSNDREYVILSF